MRWLFAGLVALNVEDFRRERLTRPMLKMYRKMLPSMSRTEREALEAGTVWWEAELFSGQPDWHHLVGYPFLLALAVVVVDPHGLGLDPGPLQQLAWQSSAAVQAHLQGHLHHVGVQLFVVVGAGADRRREGAGAQEEPTARPRNKCCPVFRGSPDDAVPGPGDAAH